MSRPGPLRLCLILAAGMISIAFGSILVRLSQEAPSLVIAFFRMFWAGLILLPFYAASPRRAGSVPSPGTVAAGAALALHFALWISSLRYTSVAVSVLLVNTSPFLVAGYYRVAGRERLTRPGISGLALAFAGSALLLVHDSYRVGEWRGAVLALGGAAALAVYFAAGRRVRQSADLLGYVYPAYLISALVLGVLVWLAGFSFTGYSQRTWIFLVLLGAVPQCLGHTAFNWSLRFLSATLVSALVLSEPILASLLAYWILGEVVGPAVALGGALVAAGIFLLSRWGIALPAVEVAAGVLHRRGRVWIQLRRGTDPLEGLWEFPGGKVAKGEDAARALLRELAEETGLTLEAEPEPLHVEEYPYPERRVRIRFFWIELDERTLPSRGRWVSGEELQQYPFPPANRRVLQLVRARLQAESESEAAPGGQ